MSVYKVDIWFDNKLFAPNVWFLDSTVMQAASNRKKSVKLKIFETLQRKCLIIVAV